MLALDAGLGRPFSTCSCLYHLMRLLDTSDANGRGAGCIRVPLDGAPGWCSEVRNDLRRGSGGAAQCGQWDPSRFQLLHQRHATAQFNGYEAANKAKQESQTRKPTPLLKRLSYIWLPITDRHHARHGTLEIREHQACIGLES